MPKRLQIPLKATFAPGEAERNMLRSAPLRQEGQPNACLPRMGSPPPHQEVVIRPASHLQIHHLLRQLPTVLGSDIDEESVTIIHLKTQLKQQATFHNGPQRTTHRNRLHDRRPDPHIV